MTENSVVNELNILAQNACRSGIKAPFSIDFSVGESISLITEIAKKCAPFGKVALLYFKNQYDLFGSRLATALKSNKNKVTHVVLPANFSDTVENYSHLFNLAEDTRLIVCLDNRLINATKYFANVRKIDCAFLLSSLSAVGCLSSNVVFKNGNKFDSISFEGGMHLLLDANILNDKQGLASVYAFVCSNSLGLIDYRINAFLTNKTINKAVYQTVSNAVVKTYPIFSFNKKEQSLILVDGFFRVELANAISYGNLYKNYAHLWSVNAFNSKNVGADALICAFLTAKVYALYFSGKFDSILHTPDFNQRAEFISKALNVSEQEVLQTIVNQENFFVKDGKIKNMIAKLIKDLNSFIGCYSFMKNAFHALGGEFSCSPEKLAPFIKHSGDLNVNGMTLTRDSGITEII